MYSAKPSRHQNNNKTEKNTCKDTDTILKKNMTGKHSSFVVCPLQSIVYDQMEEASSI